MTDEANDQIDRLERTIHRVFARVSVLESRLSALEPSAIDAPVDPEAAPDRPSETLGASLKRQRLARSQSLRDVEHATGISNPYLSQLENDLVRDPGARKLYALAKHYGIPIAHLCELLETAR